MKEGRKEGNGNEVEGKKRVRGKDSDEANLEKRSQTRGKGVNIDKIVITSGSEERGKKKRLANRQTGASART